MSTNADPKIVHSLDARYYIDAEVFRAERSGLLAKTWQFACHVSALESPGDHVTFDIAGHSLFAVRGEDGKIRAFYNVCQHRAHQLVQGAGNSRRIVCPYHAWTYELDGRFRSGPNTKAVPGFDGDSICLTAVRVEEFCGFVFVNLDPDAAGMDEWFPEARAQLSAYVPHIDRLRPLLWVDVEEACNWKVSVENYSECYHCRLNHPTFATGVIKAETYNIQPQGRCLRHTTECQNLDRMSYPIDLDANEYAGKYSSWFLFPMFSFQVYPGNTLNTYHWRALDVDRVVVWRGWYTVDGDESETVRSLAQQDLDTTVAEDIRLVESVQKGLSSPGYRPGPLVVDPDQGVNSEHSIQALQSWFLGNQ